MSIIVLSLIAAFAGAIPWFDSDNSKKKYNNSVVMVIAFVVSGVIGAIVAYVATPLFYGPFLGLTSWILFFGLVNGIVAWLSNEKVTVGTFLVFGFLVVASIRGFAGSRVFCAEDYKNMIAVTEEKTFESSLKPVDATHIRVVSLDQARWLGEKALGQASGSIGSKFKVGEYEIQRVREELYWVAPLDFRGWSKWVNADTTPGFIMVSAEDRNREPQIHLNLKMRYLQSSYFSDNLVRHIYFEGYVGEGLTDYSFEVDDELKPHWVVTRYTPSIGYFAPKILGALIVDPETGKIEKFNLDDMPDWVDRVFPEQLVGNYLSWKGELIHGWINSWWGETEVEVPTPYGRDKNAVYLVYGDDGRAYFGTGLTSPSSSDKALTGFVLVDSRTGSARKFRMRGPNEEAVLQAVNSTVSNFKGYVGTEPIPYNIYGEFSWVVPVVSDTGILQRIAVVRAVNGTTVLGNDLSETLREYRSLLASDGFNVTATTNSARVERTDLHVLRIGVEPFKDRGQFYLMFNEIPGVVFTATTDKSPVLPLTHEGDEVNITFIDTKDSVVEIEKFVSKTISIRSSEEKTALDSHRIPAKAEDAKIKEGLDAKAVVSNMSEEDLKALLALRKK